MHNLSTAELEELAANYNIELRDDDLQPVQELVESLLTNIEAVNEVPLPASTQKAFTGRSWDEPIDDPNNSVIIVCDVTAEETDSELLSEISIGVKDVISVAGIPMTGGSKILSGHVPSEDATVVRRLLKHGGSVVAKTNCDELATSGRGTTSAYGEISNPYDNNRTAGGSSGGSAVAVATGRTDVALGTDTSGSVQLPAAVCGIIGLKPTHGLVPLSGVIEHAYTMDHIAFFSSTIDQQARLLKSTAGKESIDPSTLQAAGRDEYQVGGYVDAINNPPEIDSLSIGLVDEGLGEGVEEYVEDHVQSLCEELDDAGATVRRVSIEHFEHARAINENISYTELASHWQANAAPHRRGGVVNERTQQSFSSAIHGKSGELGVYYKSKLLAGAHLIENEQSRYYTQAQGSREVLLSEFEKALEEVDVLLYPTIPGIAPRLDKIDTTTLDFARNTRQATVTRLPAMTLPTGQYEGLPLGTELVAGLFEENTLLSISSCLAQNLERGGVFRR